MVQIFNDLYIRPEDVRCQITLRRYKDYDYFILSGCGVLISAILFFILHIGDPLFFYTFVIFLIATSFFCLLMLMSGENGKLFRNKDKILITGTGIALRDYHGIVWYLMPFAKVTGINYGYRDTIESKAPDPDARMPIFIRFDLADGKQFTIRLKDIVRGEERKIFPYLPAMRQDDPPALPGSA